MLEKRVLAGLLLVLYLGPLPACAESPEFLELTLEPIPAAAEMSAAIGKAGAATQQRTELSRLYAGWGYDTMAELYLATAELPEISWLEARLAAVENHWTVPATEDPEKRLEEDLAVASRVGELAAQGSYGEAVQEAESALAEHVSFRVASEWAYAKLLQAAAGQSVPWPERELAFRVLATGGNAVGVTPLRLGRAGTFDFLSAIAPSLFHDQRLSYVLGRVALMHLDEVGSKETRALLEQRIRDRLERLSRDLGLGEP